MAYCDTHDVTDFNGVDSGDILCEEAVFGTDFHEDALCVVDSVALRLLFPFSVGESPISVMNVFYGILPEMRQVQTESIGQDTDRAEGCLDGSEGVVEFDKQNGGIFGDGNTVAKNGGAEETNPSAVGRISGMEDSVPGSGRRRSAGYLNCGQVL